MLSPKSASGASPDGVVWTVRTVARVELLWIVAGAGLTGVPAAVGEGGGGGGDWLVTESRQGCVCHQ